MALSFWRDNCRVSNRRLTKELGYALQFPSYREGLRPASRLRLSIDVRLQILTKAIPTHLKPTALQPGSKA